MAGYRQPGGLRVSSDIGPVFSDQIQKIYRDNNKDYPQPVRKGTITIGGEIMNSNVVITKGEDGRYVVTVPSFPGAFLSAGPSRKPGKIFGKRFPCTLNPLRILSPTRVPAWLMLPFEIAVTRVRQRED